MLSLTEKPLTFLKYRGHKYKVNLSFDHVIKYIEIAENDDIKLEDATRQSIDLFFGDQQLPDDYEFFELAFKAINKEINSNPYGKNQPQNTAYDRQTVTKQYFSYSKDAGMIYASFYQQYGIDLLKELGKMHWSVFQALFNALDDNTAIQKLIELRRKDPSDVSSENRGKLLELQNYYSLQKSSSKTQAKVFNDPGLTSVFSGLFNQAKKGG